MARELGNKPPLTTFCHVELEMVSAWDLSKQLRTLKGTGCLPVALAISVPLCRDQHDAAG